MPLGPLNRARYYPRIWDQKVTNVFKWVNGGFPLDQDRILIYRT
jgi:hypothetical protein